MSGLLRLHADFCSPLAGPPRVISFFSRRPGRLHVNACLSCPHSHRWRPSRISSHRSRLSPACQLAKRDVHGIAFLGKKNRRPWLRVECDMIRAGSYRAWFLQATGRHIVSAMNELPFGVDKCSMYTNFFRSLMTSQRAGEYSVCDTGIIHSAAAAAGAGTTEDFPDAIHLTSCLLVSLASQHEHDARCNRCPQTRCSPLCLALHSASLTTPILSWASVFFSEASHHTTPHLFSNPRRHANLLFGYYHHCICSVVSNASKHCSPYPRLQIKPYHITSLQIPHPSQNLSIIARHPRILQQQPKHIHLHILLP